VTVAIDHVLVVVDDLDAAAATYESELGLSSVAGGRHAGHGTANRIVPLGDDYIELVALVDPDEAETSPFGSYMRRRLAESGAGSPVGLALRTDDIAALAARTGDRPFEMSRTRLDGVVLSWQMLALDAALELGLPFFIQWNVPADEHPGRASVVHRRPVGGIAWVEVGGDADRLADWIADTAVPVRAVAGPPGPCRFAVAVEGADPIVIG
jgi:hypothetical protein